MCERNSNNCCTPPTGDLARNPGMFPNWESTGDLSVLRPHSIH